MLRQVLSKLVDILSLICRPCKESNCCSMCMSMFSAGNLIFICFMKIGQFSKL